MGSKRENLFFHGMDKKLDAKLSRWNTVSFLVMLALLVCVWSWIPYDVRTYLLSYYERVSS